MDRRVPRSLAMIGSLALCLFAAGCGMGGNRPEAGTNPTAPPSPEESPTEVACQGASPYLPVDEGNRWVYDAATPDYTGWQWTDVISKAEDKRFTLTSSVDAPFVPQRAQVSPQEWICLEAGFRRVPTPTRGVGGTAKVQLTKYQGIDLPYDPQVGDQWNWETFYAETTTTKDGSYDSYITIDGVGVAQGMEEVTVPAGTFRALLVVSSLTTRTAEKEVTTTVTEDRSWYVDGVGLVKREIDFQGSKLSMELAQTNLAI